MDNHIRLWITMWISADFVDMYAFLAIVDNFFVKNPLCLYHAQTVLKNAKNYLAKILALYILVC